MSDLRERITFITPHFGRSNGGIGVSAERIVTSLSERYDIDVIVPQRGEPPRAVSTCRIPAGHLHQLGGSIKDSRALQFVTEYITRVLQRSSLILSFSAGRESFAAAYAAAILNVPSVLCCRGDDIDLGVFADDAWRLHFALSNAREIACVSDEMNHKVRSFCPGKTVTTITNGTDPVLFPFHADYQRRTSPLLGLFGEIKWKKGLDTLLPVLRECRSTLRIVGEVRDESRKLLHGFCALNPEIESHLELVPYTADLPELVKQYHQVDIVCIPSYYEGTPNVLLEAMSCGKVCIASAVGGCRDFIQDGENGFLCEPGNVSSFLNALERVQALSDPALESIRRCARNTVESEGTWELEQEKYNDLVERCIRDRH